MITNDAKIAKLREWRENPVRFVREVLKAEPDDWQADFLQATTTHQRVALKACKGPGKTTGLAWLGWNFLATRPHPKVICTSITGDNLKDGLWSEFSKWQQKSPDWLGMDFTWTAERIFYKRHPETWFASARQWSKGADPTQQADTLAGIHAEYVLFLVDEAGGIPDAVVAAAEGGLSTGIETKLVMAGNPTHLTGPLYRACEKERKYYYVQEITGDPDDPKRAKRINIDWARKQIATYGREHPWTLVNVFGKFPPGQANTLISLADARAAGARSIALADIVAYPIVLGVDVARTGDDKTVYAVRQGRAVLEMIERRNRSLMVTADEVAGLIRRWEPQASFVDATGIGAGVVDRLRAMGHIVTEVHGSQASPDPVYYNRRAYMWGMMANWVKGEVSIPNDEELFEQMAAPELQYRKNDDKMIVESKDDMKKRGLSSPDKADALALTFAAPVAMQDPRARRKQRRQKRAWDYDPYNDERV